MTRVAVAVPDEIRWDALTMRQFREAAASQLPPARGVRIDGRAIELDVDGDDGAPIASRALDLAATIARDLRDAGEHLLFEHLPAPLRAREEPTAALLRRGDLLRTGPARFAYGGELAALLEGLDALLRDFASGLGAESRQYPTTVGTGSLIRSGYLKAFPQHALFVAPAGRSADGLHALGALEHAPAGAEATLLAGHDQILAPTVCYPCLESLQGARFGSARRVTAVNPCHRHEVLAEDKLDRLQTFRMREIVAFGDEADVLAMLDQSLEWTSGRLREWGIAHRAITAMDPFFAGAAGNKQFFQSAFALKRELQIRLDDSRWLAVASFNNHQRSLTRVFDIAGESGPMSSGCVGWGYERLLYGLFAQLGCDTSAWPAPLRAALRTG